MPPNNPCRILIIAVAMLLFLIPACERELDNPWDEKSTLKPEDWAPQDFQVEDVSPVEKKLTWTYDDKNIEGFKLDRKKGDEPWQVGFQTFTKETRSWNDSDIIPDPELSYSYKLLAYAGSQTSAEKSVTSSAAIPAPTNLTVTPNTITSVTLNWQNNSIGEEGFKIERRIEGGNWEVIATTTANSYNDNNFELNTQVYYRVSAFITQYQSSYTQNSFNSQIPAPTNLQITKNSITSITLYWQSNSNGEDGFRLERKQSTGNWELIITLSGTSYTDEAMELNTDVSYRIAAYYGQYDSDFAENSFNSQIPALENLTITANSAISVTLNWSYSLNGHEGFKIERKIDNGSWEMLVENLNPNQNDYTDHEVDLFQHEYKYRVYTFIGSYNSIKSDAMIQKIEIGSIVFGGIVFYLDGNSGGLVSAENDQSTYADWGCNGSTIGGTGTGTGIGTGATNTAAIVAGCGQSGIAARICNDLVLNSYNDWFLPSKDELNLMYQNLKLDGIGGFAGSYWSSSENGSYSVWGQDFSSGYQYNYSKIINNRVRAVRTF